MLKTWRSSSQVRFVFITCDCHFNHSLHPLHTRPSLSLFLILLFSYDERQRERERRTIKSNDECLSPLTESWRKQRLDIDEWDFHHLFLPPQRPIYSSSIYIFFFNYNWLSWGLWLGWCWQERENLSKRDEKSRFASFTNCIWEQVES